MMVMYQRNMGSNPTFLRNFWLFFNVAFSLTHAVLSVIGGATNNLFWFGVSDVCLAVQIFGLILVLNITTSRLSGYLRKLTQEKDALGGTATNFGPALRKMMWVRIYMIAILILVMLYLIAGPGGASSTLSKPSQPIFYDNATFTALNVVPPLLSCILHCTLLYMLRRPQPKSERPTMKETKEVVSSSTRQSTSCAPPKRETSPETRESGGSATRTSTSYPPAKKVDVSVVVVVVDVPKQNDTDILVII